LKPYNRGIMKYKQDQLLEVIWIDADTVVDWITPEEATEKPKSKFKTIGYFSGIDKEFLYLSWSIGIEGNLDRTKDSIPLGCIKKIRKIK